MTNFIFCLIFIQVSIFLIAGVVLFASLIIGYFDSKTSSPRLMTRPRPRRERQQRQPVALTRMEIDYLLGS